MTGRDGKATLLLSSCGGAAGIAAISLLEPMRDTLRIVGCDSSERSFAQELLDHYVVVPPIKSEEYRQSVLSVLDDNLIDAWVPLNSGELVIAAELERELLRRNVAWPRIALGTARMLTDKLAAYQLLAASGVPVGPFVAGCGCSDIPLDWSKVVLKPRTGAGSRRVRILRRTEVNRADLPEDFLAQKFLSGVEVSLDGIALDTDRIVGPIARRRVQVRHGLAVISDSVPPDHHLDELFARVVSATGLLGPLNLQVIFSDGEPWVIDLNPRLPAGGMPLTAALGLNMPLTVVRWLLFGTDSIPPVVRSSQPMRHYKYLADKIVELPR